MPQTPAHLTVDPLRYTLSVTLTPATGTLVLARRNGSSTYDVVSMPVTISTPTDFWLTDGGDVTVSMKLDNGQEVAADGAATQLVTVPASGGKAVRPSADALRATGVVSSSDLSRLKARGAWAGTTVYAVNDTITANGVAWRCILAHTSGGSFSADPTKWERFGVGQVTSSAPGSPAADDLWYDKANDQWKRWSGSAWIPEGSGAYVPAQRNSVVVFGTSLENIAGTGPSTLDPAFSSDAIKGRGWFNWLQAYLGQRLRMLNQAGVGGNTYTQMLARIQADVLAFDPGWVFMGGPVNDIANGASFASIQSDLLAMLDLLAGRRVVLLNAAPSTSYDTNAKRTVLHQWNRYVHELPVTRKGVTVVDCWRVLADPATGSPATGMAIDSVHFSDMAAARVGRAVADAVAPLVQARPSRWSGLTDPENVCGNPALTAGTGWSLMNAAGRTVAYSALPDRQGSEAVLTLTGVTDGLESAVQYIEPVGNGRYAAGDIVQMEARIRWSSLVPVGGATVKTFLPYLRIMPRKADSSFGLTVFAMQTASSEQLAIVGAPSSGDVVVRTPRVTLPATIANLYLAAGWVGAASGEVRVSDISVIKNAT